MRISLFWRTFLLVGGLIILSLLLTLKLVREFERPPPEQQIAWEIASIVNLTRSALVSSEGPRRTLLLDELARVENVRVAPMEPTDHTAPLPNPEETYRLERSLRAILGPATRIAGQVNDEPGLWVGFDIDDDAYWLVLSLERWTRRRAPPWWLIGSIAAAVSMIGAIAISGFVNRPLSRLARAIGQISHGGPAQPLPESGPTELATLNRRFNRMAQDLQALETDRVLALAGISHDIRTPLTRLRLEIELSRLDDADKASMSSDIERIDGIVGKFVEYARIGSQSDRAASLPEIDAKAVIASMLEARHGPVSESHAALTLTLPPTLPWRGEVLDIERIVSNLVENAQRYGRGPDDTAAQITVAARRGARGLEIEVSDRGPGVPEDQRDRLLHPFARLDAARGDPGGSGLGLAIVSRIARRYGGACRIENRPGGGLVVSVELPDAA